MVYDTILTWRLFTAMTLQSVLSAMTITLMNFKVIERVFMGTENQVSASYTDPYKHC